MPATSAPVSGKHYGVPSQPGSHQKFRQIAEEVYDVDSYIAAGLNDAHYSLADMAIVHIVKKSGTAGTEPIIQWVRNRALMGTTVDGTTNGLGRWGYQGESIELYGQQDMSKFQYASTDTANTHYLIVEYYELD